MQPTWSAESVAGAGAGDPLLLALLVIASTK
jgi:hypothetical protein